MSAAQPLPASADEPTASASTRSFWDGAPKLVAGLATLVGSLAAVATVLVQAGVFGSPATRAHTPQAQTTQARTTQAQTIQAQTIQAVAPKTELDGTLRALNDLLDESARTKGDLGALIADVDRDPPIERATALREIDAIVRQREGLHRELAGLSAPDELADALALLRDSVTASLADDRLVRRWIVARYDGNGAADGLWQAQLEASAEATRAKGKFRSEYAGILLAAGLSSSIPDY